MKARICRIVKDQCGNPHIGRRWTAIVTVLILGLAVGVAFAQRRPATRPEIEHQEQRELMMAGRRNVLSRLLEQFVDQAREIEAALRERGDDPGEDGYVMRAELNALQEHIGLVERQLRNLEQRDRPRPEADERNAEEEAKRLEKHLERLREVREEAVERVSHMEMELKALGDRQPETRERLESELRRLEMLTREQERFEQRRVQIEPRSEAEHARKAIEMSRMRAREARERAQGEDGRMRDLTERLRELQRHARETERDLDRIDDKDSIEAQELRASLDTTHEEMAQIQRELSRLRTEAARAEAARAGAGRAVARSRRRPQDDPNREELLRQSHEGLMAHIRITEDKLKEAEEQDRPETAERLRRILEQLQERREALRQEAGTLTEAPRERPGIEVEVEELRGKVDGMHEEMAQMREMLQQLLERREVEKEETPASPAY